MIEFKRKSMYNTLYVLFLYCEMIKGILGFSLFQNNS